MYKNLNDYIELYVNKLYDFKLNFIYFQKDKRKEMNKAVIKKENL